jgi:hypothetical protein
MVTNTKPEHSGREPSIARLSPLDGPEKTPCRFEDSLLAFDLAVEWCRQGDECAPNAAEVTP